MPAPSAGGVPAPMWKSTTYGPMDGNGRRVSRVAITAAATSATSESRCAASIRRWVWASSTQQPTRPASRPAARSQTSSGLSRDCSILAVSSARRCA
ncbi:hypothetical protein ACFQS1_18525 [Paractinoplanes rhizophilus]|uniref:Uncharacterized protein n=1 Tax=Paractinoplanes rhizophilus TaxID=1416877 RepID=A0ABW2HS31_9ACTN|nr:hypothetical protein [Actinoplanes sp.]